MQFARQVAALVLTHVLQMCGQLCKGFCTFTHLQVKLIAFTFQGKLFTATCVKQCASLQQVHIKSQQATNGHDGYANTRQLQGFSDLNLATLDTADAAGSQCFCLPANGIHLLFANISCQHKTPCIFSPCITHFDGQVHLSQLA